MAEVFRSRKPRQKLLESLKCMAEIGLASLKHEDKNEQARLQEEYYFKLVEQDMEKYNTAITFINKWI